MAETSLLIVPISMEPTTKDVPMDSVRQEMLKLLWYETTFSLANNTKWKEKNSL